MEQICKIFYNNKKKFNSSNADIRSQKLKFKTKANTLKDLITSVEKVARGE